MTQNKNRVPELMKMRVKDRKRVKSNLEGQGDRKSGKGAVLLVLECTDTIYKVRKKGKKSKLQSPQVERWFKSSKRQRKSTYFETNVT